MSGPLDPLVGETHPSALTLMLRTAAAFFAEEALTFAAVLEAADFEPMPPSDAVRLFGARLCQIAQDMADPLFAGTTTMIPHCGLIS